MLVYVVRHGETQYNKEEMFRGRKDIALNTEGEKQAARAGLYFKGKDVKRIITSPLIRARQTANAISLAIEVPVETAEEFTDMDFGIWEGVSLSEVARLYPQEFQLWGRSPQRLRLKQGESLAQVRKRVHRGIQRLSAGQEGNMVIVTHRVLCKLMIMYAMNIPNSHFWDVKYDPASISLIEKKGEKMTVLFVNDTCHLRDGSGQSGYNDF